MLTCITNASSLEAHITAYVSDCVGLLNFFVMLISIYFNSTQPMSVLMKRVKVNRKLSIRRI